MISDSIVHNDVVRVKVRVHGFPILASNTRRRLVHATSVIAPIGGFETFGAAARVRIVIARVVVARFVANPIPQHLPCAVGRASRIVAHVPRVAAFASKRIRRERKRAKVPGSVANAGEAPGAAPAVRIAAKGMIPDAEARYAHELPIHAIGPATRGVYTPPVIVCIMCVALHVRVHARHRKKEGGDDDGHPAKKKTPRKKTAPLPGSRTGQLGNTRSVLQTVAACMHSSFRTHVF